MSLVFNGVYLVDNGGGGGGPSGSDAILTVSVPTGSTVTATKGGVTLTPTMWVQAADATLDCALFVINPNLFDALNAWTVTATLGIDTASDTVIISSNKQYDLVLSYSQYTYIYKRGYINTTLTGGLTNSGYIYGSTALTAATYNANNIYIATDNCAGTSNVIDLTNYTTIYYVSRAGNQYALLHPWLCVASSKNLNNYLIRIFPESATESIKSADISNVTGNYYIAAITSTANGYGNVYEIYLE